MKKVLILLVIILTTSITFDAIAQQLLNPSSSFSERKTAYFTMKDGSKVEANIVRISYKKGQINELKLKNAEGKKIKLTPADIKSMYLPQSAMEKLSQLDKFMSDATMWKSDSLDNQKISNGYVYFESTDVQMGKKTRKFLMQILNPAFSSKVKILNDPFSSETASLGIAGVKLAGGDLKSYYFKKGNQVAYLLRKKDYKKQFKEIWSDCPALIEKYVENPNWTDLAKHVYEYSNQCK